MYLRKTTAAAILSIAPAPEVTPIAARKAARRAVAPVPPPPPPAAIDLSAMSAEGAKKALALAFPRHVEGKTVPATEATAAAAFAYLTARDDVSIAEAKKDASGNVLRLAMGDAESILGDGWEATWKTQKSEIDWGALAKELAIPSETIERFRKPVKRVLNVREKAE